MERYMDINGDSGVIAYECGATYIRVQFSSGTAYLYTYESTGSHNIERMKALARSGEGLHEALFVRWSFRQQVEFRFGPSPLPPPRLHI